MKALKKQSLSTMKINNLRLILNTIIEKEPISRAELVRLTDISKPTVSLLVEELINKNIVIEIGFGQSTLGRKPIMLRFNNTSNFFLIVEIGQHHYTCAITDLKGNILKEQTNDFELSIRLSNRLNIIRNSMNKIIDELKIDVDAISKIIIITPVYFLKRDILLNPSETKNLEELYEKKLINLVKKSLGPTKDIFLHHATRPYLLLMAEKNLGKAQNYDNVLYIDFDYGLGSSYMIKGKIIDTKLHQIGGFFTNLEEFKNFNHQSDSFGILENKFSGKAIQTKAINQIEKGTPSKIAELVKNDISQITGHTVFEAAMQKDLLAYSILKEAFSYFNLALCNMINLLAPELIIIGGRFIKYGDFIIQLIMDEINEKVVIIPEITVSELPRNASLLGAVHYLISQTDFLYDIVI